MPNLPIVANPISDFLAKVHLAPAQATKSLTIWPLVLNDGETHTKGAPYIALSDALAKGALQIDEISEEGAVSRVRVTNSGDIAALFLFGEEIRGAKQNRVANASFLVPKASEIVIDVSCVEHGRWDRPTGARFEGSEDVISPCMRMEMAAQVTQSRAQGGRFATDQGEVWNQISERIARSGVASDTEAYADYRASRSEDLASVTSAFHLVERQVGFVACSGDRVVGLEAIGRPEVFRTDFQALLRSYALDAVDAALVRTIDDRSDRGPHFSHPETFLDTVAQAPVKRGRSLGLGEDLRVSGPNVAGCALSQHGLVHMTVFPAQGE
jgi:hypothetical protein